MVSSKSARIERNSIAYFTASGNCSLRYVDFPHSKIANKGNAVVMAEIKVYPKDLVTKISRNGRNSVGIVDKVAAIDSDSDSEFEDDTPLENGMIRVTWYPRGANENVNENKVTVVDRSCLPRDVVRMKNGNQLGTVTNVEVFADLMPLGTRKLLKNIPLKKCTQFLPFLDDDIVVLNNWYGRVLNLTGYYVFKFPNNARYSYPFMKPVNFEEMFPNISDLGGFCHEIYTMYPGQHLAGCGLSFSETNWISGPSIKFKKRMRYIFTVEKIQLSSATVKWLNECATPSILISEEEKPCDYVVGPELEKLHSLNTFWCGHIYVGDRLQYKLSKDDANCLNRQKEVRYERTNRKRRKRKCRRVNSSSSSWTTTQHPKEDQTEKTTENNDGKVSDESTDNENQDDNEDVSAEIKDKNGETSSLIAKKTDGGIQLPADKQCEHNATALDVCDCALAIKVLGNVYIYAMVNTETKEINFEVQASQPIHQKITKDIMQMSIPIPSLEDHDKYEYFTKLLTMFIAYKNQTLPQCKEFQYWMKLKEKYVKGNVDAFDKSTEETEQDEITKEHPLHHENLLKVRIKLNESCEPDSCLSEQTMSTLKIVGRNAEYKEGNILAVEVTCTKSFVDIQWQDGTWSSQVNTVDVCAAHHVDQNDFCPGDFVIDKRNRVSEISKNYGLVVTANASTRMVNVKWFKNEFPEEVIETLSAYDLADHPLFTYRISDVIYNHKRQKEIESPLVGELLGVNCNGFLEVLWSDGVKGTARPQDVSSYVPDEESECSSMSDSDDSSSESDGSWVSLHSDDEPPTPQSDKSVGTSDFTEATTTGNEDQLSTNTEINGRTKDLKSGQEAGDVANGIYKDFKFIDDDLTSPEEEVSGQKAIKRCNNPTPSVSKQEPSNEKNGTAIEQVHCLPEVFISHQFATLKLQMTNQRSFMKAVNRDMNLLKSSQSQGIYVKIYEDSLHLLSVMIKGPEKTPYEHGLFFFDVMFPSNYPHEPPAVHYVSYSPRLNPNLYENGTVCVSLLGTWRGKGNEKWTKESNILQVLLSVQGLILNVEPYYNEAGYEGHRGTSEGMRNSRSYNEMVLLRMVQHLTNLIKNPPKPFETETTAYCKDHVPLFIKFVTEIIEANDDQAESIQKNLDYPLLPISKGCLESLHGKLKDLKSIVSKKLDLHV